MGQPCLFSPVSSQQRVGGRPSAGLTALLLHCTVYSALASRAAAAHKFASTADTCVGTDRSVGSLLQSQQYQWECSQQCQHSYFGDVGKQKVDPEGGLANKWIGLEFMRITSRYAQSTCPLAGTTCVVKLLIDVLLSVISYPLRKDFHLPDASRLVTHAHNLHHGTVAFGLGGFPAAAQNLQTSRLGISQHHNSSLLHQVAPCRATEQATFR